MHKAIIAFIATLLIIFAGWWGISRMTEPVADTQVIEETTEAPSEGLTEAQEAEEEGGEEELQEETTSAVEDIPELNPVENTNPFEGSYSNPFGN